MTGRMRSNLAPVIAGLTMLSLWLTLALSSLIALPGRAAAHELRPAVADLELGPDAVQLTIELTIEALLAGIDLDAHDDTTESPEARTYEALRNTAPAMLAARLEAGWDSLAAGITIEADGRRLTPRLAGVEVPGVGDTDLPRDSTLRITAPLPAGWQAVRLGWQASYGPLILRQVGVDDGYTAYLDRGALSDPIAATGGPDRSAPVVFLGYIAIGFEHIVPAGLDHILFVLGLFFLSLRPGPLLWQVTAFTVAHTITLAAGILGLVTIPASIVEPLIAASIVYVGIENVLVRGLTPWRPVIVFLFGLLHGLGFASVLGDIGLDPGTFVLGLVGFNVGVELGQISVIAAAYLAVGFWFGDKPWYRARIATPASLVIAAFGAVWLAERLLA